MAPGFFRILLVAIALFAWWRGGRDERIVAALCLGGAVASLFLAAPVESRFEGLETGVFLVDLALLGGFVAVALRSSRFWPMWVAGLQLTATLGHMLKAFDTHLLPQAYGAALTFWSYPILLILAVGTWRSYARRKTAGLTVAA